MKIHQAVERSSARLEQWRGLALRYDILIIAHRAATLAAVTWPRA